MTDQVGSVVILEKPDPQQFALPAYDPDRRCPHCGYDTVTTKAVDAYLLGYGYTWPWQRLRRTCVRCEAVWDEEPLSAPGTDLGRRQAIYYMWWRNRLSEIWQEKAYWRERDAY